jgi:hypothetical protein
MITRRDVVVGLGGALLLDDRAMSAEKDAEAGRGLIALPGKAPLIKQTFRPPNYENPSGGSAQRIHAQREVLRPLSPRKHSESGYAHMASASRRRQRGRDPRMVARRAQAQLRYRERRRNQSALAKPPWALLATSTWSAMATRCHRHAK